MPPKFPLQVVSLKSILFSGETTSVYLQGDEGEFELLAFHHPLMSAIPPGKIFIAGHDPIPIRNGVVLFNDNRCTIIVEEVEDSPVKGISWADYEAQKAKPDEGTKKKK